MKKEDFLNTYKDIQKRYKELFENIAPNILIEEQKKYEKISAKADFWNDSDNAKKILKLTTL